MPFQEIYRQVAMSESTNPSPRWNGHLRYLHLAADFVVIVIIMAWYSYGSFDACEWAYRDFAHESGIPQDQIAEVLETRSGVIDPGWTDCFRGWINLKLYGLPPSMVRMITEQGD
jgi:hypothetical protein